ncbi:MAG TPA: DUF4139 domain-containing protein [Polyangiaceae bacterium]|nr:DUF4139 domain-containing protein [Polyangiaceae bacterium]
MVLKNIRSGSRRSFGRALGALVSSACFWASAAGAQALAPAKAPPAPPKAAPTKPPAVATKVSGDADRRQVTITVYNQGFGLVREVRELADLGKGRVALEFRDVASTIQPETVAVKSLGGGLSVLEQNYRFDLLTPETLLDKYVGRNVRAYRYHEATGKEDVVDAKLLSVANGPVLQMGGEITFGYPGRLAFPELPPDLIAKPTLVWLVDSAQPKQSLEVSYLAQSLSWKADYVFVVNDKDDSGDLVGWVTLQNQSGATYRDAELKLVAGDVNRVRDEAPAPQRMYKMEAAGAVSKPQFKEEGLFEYHLYTLGRPTTLRDKEQKQVTLLEAQNIGVTKKLLFEGQEYWYRSQYGQVAQKQKVGVFLDFKNDEAHHLGMPLPKGTIRVYKADKAGAKQFVGEDAIDHTARDEKVRIKMGEAFDVVADAKQTDYKVLGNCTSESAWQVEFRNHKDEAVRVEAREPVGGDWTIVESSLPAKKEDANTAVFDVPVPKRGATKLTYRVRVRWC